MERVPITGHTAYLRPGNDDVKAVVELQLDVSGLERPAHFDRYGFTFDVLVDTRLVFSAASPLPDLCVQRKQFGDPFDVEWIYFSAYLLGAVLDVLGGDVPVYLELDTNLAYEGDFYNDVALRTGPPLQSNARSMRDLFRYPYS